MRFESYSNVHLKYFRIFESHFDFQTEALDLNKQDNANNLNQPGLQVEADNLGQLGLQVEADNLGQQVVADNLNRPDSMDDILNQPDSQDTMIIAGS